jgi:hypothetical protein
MQYIEDYLLNRKIYRIFRCGAKPYLNSTKENYASIFYNSSLGICAQQYAIF